MKKFIVKNENVGKRLDVFLQENNKEFSRSYIKTLTQENKVLLNGIVPKKSGEKLKLNDEIVLQDIELQIPSTEPENLPLDIVFQDSCLAVINKAQGMVVHAGNGNFSGTLVNALLYHIKDLSGINGVLRAGIVHRLDKNTSGLLLVAKNDNAHRLLAKQIEEKTCVRKYVAILDGNVANDSGRIETLISRNPKNRTLMTTHVQDGKSAITEYQVLERFEKHCLVEFSLKTGRTHQIRVHCKEVLNHSITGDREYGGLPAKNLAKRDSISQGQYLHAYKISFKHPQTNKEMTFKAECPEYFKKLLTHLRQNEKI